MHFKKIIFFFFSCRHLGSIEEIDPVEGQTRDKNSIEGLYMANGKYLWRTLICKASLRIKWQKKRTLFINHLVLLALEH